MEELERARLSIAICDDEAVSLDYIEQMTEQVLGSQWELDLFCTDSPNELLEQAPHVQIAILDIQLPEQNGIVLAQKLLEKNPDVLEYYQNKFRYIMVDEYQDTNHAQYLFVKLLSQKHGNICGAEGSDGYTASQISAPGGLYGCWRRRPICHQDQWYGADGGNGNHNLSGTKGTHHLHQSAKWAAISDPGKAG